VWKRIIYLTIFFVLIAAGTNSVLAQTSSSDPIAICFAPGTPEETVVRAYAMAPWAQVPNSLGDPFDTFQLASRWTGSATASPLDGSSSSQGDPIILTWSVVSDGTPIPGYNGEPANPSNLQAFLEGIYGAGNWLPVLQQVFDRWSVLTGINYVYEPADDGVTLGPGTSGVIGVRGDVRLGGHYIDGGFGILGYNFYPTVGDMVIDTGRTAPPSNSSWYDDTSQNSRGLRNVVAHEAGHGIGLFHVCPVDGSKLMEPFVNTGFDGPQHDDIRGSNRQYGDFFEDDDTPGTAADLGLLGPTTTIGDLSIDDNSDIDFYAIGLAGGTSLDVTLSPVGFTYLEGPQISGSCTAGSSINTLPVHDLSVQILDIDGSTVIASADINPAGQPEGVTSVVLPSGAGFIEVAGSADDDIQLYELDLTTVALPDFIFGDGFELGDTSVWSSTKP